MVSGQPTSTNAEAMGVADVHRLVDEVTPAGSPPEDVAATADQRSTGQATGPPPGEKVLEGAKKPKEEKEPKKVYEAGGIVVCDGKIVLRFTDGQNWIFPKGKLKKHESPEDAAIREAVEETGLKVEIVGNAGDFVMKTEGKKRRFVFYLMRAIDKTWDWPHHEGRDTFLLDADRVGALVHRRYRKLWEGCEDRVRALAAQET